MNLFNRFQITSPLLLPLWSGRFWEINLHFSCIHRPIFVTLGKMTDADKLKNPQHSGSNPADIRIQICINPEMQI